MKRIRYNKVGNQLVSEDLIGGSEIYIASLNLEQLTYVITKKTDNTLVITEKAPSSQMLKIKVKRKLKDLGVHFESEVRPQIKLGDENENS